MQPPNNLPEQDNNDVRFAPPGSQPPVPPNNPPQAYEVQPVQPISPAPSRQLPRPDEAETPLQRALWGVSGAAGCLLLLALLVVIPAAITAGTIGGAFGLVGNAFNALMNPNPPVAGVSTSQTIVNGVRPLGQLVSTSAQVAKADIGVNIVQGRFTQCSHNANHVAQGTIEAGIDLLQVEPGAVTYNTTTDTYTLTVPAPTITSCRIDFIDQYDRGQPPPGCRVDWDDMRQIAQFAALSDFRDDAIEGGLLVTAERDATIALSSFVGALTGSNVEVIFIQTDNQNSGCNPQPPTDWSQDELGSWVRLR